jgi:hypothetical protein
LYKTVSGLGNLGSQDMQFDKSNANKLYYTSGNTLYYTLINENPLVEYTEKTWDEGDYTGGSSATLGFTHKGQSQNSNVFLFDDGANSLIVSWKRDTDESETLSRPANYNESHLQRNDDSDPYVLVMTDSPTQATRRYNRDFSDAGTQISTGTPHNDMNNTKWFYSLWGSGICGVGQETLASPGDDSWLENHTCSVSDGIPSNHIDGGYYGQWLVVGQYQANDNGNDGDIMPNSAYWDEYTNEIYIVKQSDGTTWRLAHSRSRPLLACSDEPRYWAQPHAVISPNGRYIAYKSTWNNAIDVTDVYLLSVPSEGQLLIK